MPLDYDNMSFEELKAIIEKRYGKEWTLEEVKKDDKKLAGAYFEFLNSMK